MESELDILSYWYDIIPLLWCRSQKFLPCTKLLPQALLQWYIYVIWNLIYPSFYQYITIIVVAVVVGIFPRWWWDNHIINLIIYNPFHRLVKGIFFRNRNMKIKERSTIKYENHSCCEEWSCCCCCMMEPIRPEWLGNQWIWDPFVTGGKGCFSF